MSTRRFAFTLSAAIVLTVPAPAAPQESKGSAAAAAADIENPFATEADARKGAMAVRAYCSVCHGPEGKGARGPDLTSANLRRGNSNRALLNNMKSGITGTDMVGFGDLGDDDQPYWQIIAYLRSVQKPPPPPPSGDKENGRRLVARHNCTNCHWIEGRGGRRAPDLAGSGAAVEYIRESILDPDANFRETPSFQHDPYQRVAVVTAQGMMIEGRWLNETGYFIQLIDGQDELRTLDKDQTEAIVKPQRSLMPSFAGLMSDQELNDLIAYVFSLRPVLPPSTEEQ